MTWLTNVEFQAAARREARQPYAHAYFLEVERKIQDVVDLVQVTGMKAGANVVFNTTNVGKPVRFALGHFSYVRCGEL